MTDYHMTIYYDGENHKLLIGTPSENGIKEVATDAHEFTMGGDRAIYWTVGCKLTGEQIRQMSRRLLDDLGK